MYYRSIVLGIGSVLSKVTFCDTSSDCVNCSRWSVKIEYRSKQTKGQQNCIIG